MPQGRNRRKATRRRTRLRSGKLCTLRGQFIADCLIHDRSALGVRVRMAGRMALPEHVKFFDDELCTLHVARVVWRQENVAGLQFIGAPCDEHTARREVAALKGKYYAVRNSR